MLSLAARRPSSQEEEHVYTSAEIAGLMSGMQSEIESDHQRRRQLKHERLGKQLPSTAVDRRLHKRRAMAEDGAKSGEAPQPSDPLAAPSSRTHSQKYSIY